MNREKDKYCALIESQRFFFDSNQTKDLDFRIETLKKLFKILKENEKELDLAIDLDFGKSSFENYLTELSLIYHEINLAVKNLKKWSKKRWVATNLTNLPASSYIKPEPLGVCLVIGAWNYPYQLSLIPLVSAIAAGNTVVLKPSELSAHTSKIMNDLLSKNFDKKIIAVVEGGVEETSELLKCQFDKIFYTGSSRVGKIIMSAAAQHLCPVTLELGGKSPAIVDKSANIKLAAKRIIWAKYINAGQTCVAPDYILVDRNVKEQLISELKVNISKYYRGDLVNSEAYVRIINKRNFDRLTSLIDPTKVIHGGKCYPESLIIEPTLMSDVRFDDRVMEDEIFGPILPIVEYKDLDWAIKNVKKLPKPLALYAFGSGKVCDKIFHEISFGGGVKNDAVVHFVNSNLPFGGVGNSGMGNYHGKFGFDTFSHYKSILQRNNMFELELKFWPYTQLKQKILKYLLS